MYPPPPSEIIQRLKHIELEVVSFGKYTIHLGFANGDKLSFGASFRYCNAEFLADSPVFDFPLTESRLVNAIGCSIAVIACDTDGTLKITFENDDVLIIYANDPMYEAYTLTIAGVEYLV